MQLQLNRGEIKSAVLEVSVFVLLVIALDCPVLGAESANWPVEESQSISNNKEWSEMLLQLKKYPMTFVKPHESHILVRAAKQWHLILDHRDRNAVNTNVVSQWGFLVGGEFVNETDGGGMVVGLSIETNALDACRKTICISFERFISCTRPSSWSGESCLPIPHASFVSNFGGDYVNSILCCIQNIFIRADSRRVDGIAAKNGHLVDAISAIGSLTYVEPELTLEHEEVRVTSSVRDRDSVTLTWATVGKLKDYWVRIDADEGDLAICGNGKVRLTGIPREGTWVYCRAISPDGKTWYQKKLRLPGGK